jgi:transcriptional regulator with XRE-family HTH domain
MKIWLVLHQLTEAHGGKRHGWTQDRIADRSGGRMDRVLVNKVAKGRNLGTSARVHEGIAAAFGLTLDELRKLIRREATIAQTIAAREARLALQYKQAVRDIKEARDAKERTAKEKERDRIEAELKEAREAHARADQMTA